MSGRTLLYRAGMITSGGAFAWLTTIATTAYVMITQPWLFVNSIFACISIYFSSIEFAQWLISELYLLSIDLCNVSEWKAGMGWGRGGNLSWLRGCAARHTSQHRSFFDFLRKYPVLEVQVFWGAIVCLRRHKSWPFASDPMSAKADNRFVEDPDF